MWGRVVEKVPCSDAFGRTCWNGIFGYLGHCFIWISGLKRRVGGLIDSVEAMLDVDVPILQPFYGGFARQVFL